MYRSCAIVTCKQTSRVLCHCCNKNLCLDHLSNHNNLINYQSNSLIVQVNLLNDQLKRIDIEKLFDNTHRKLEKWKDDIIKKIYRFYDNKCEDFHRYYIQQIHQQQKDIDDIYIKLTENIINENNMNEFQSKIIDIKQKLDIIEQNNIPININYLSIDNNLITIGESKTQDFDITNLSSPYYTLNYSEKLGSALAINDQFLLIDQNPILTLFDSNLTIIQQSLWKYGNINDMCWSSQLSSFIIITDKNKTLLVDQNDLLINSIKEFNNQLWISCTCYNSLLYLLSSNNAIIEYSLYPLISYTRRWDPPITCKKNEFIKHINCNYNTFALIVVSISNKNVCLILRSLTTFDQLYSIVLDIKHSLYHLPIRCCSLKDNQWLVIDGNTSQLFHIDNDKKLKGILTYNSPPYNAILFDSNKLVIRTEDTINFHQLLY